MRDHLELERLPDGGDEALPDRGVVGLVVGAWQLAEKNELVASVENNHVGPDRRVHGPMLPSRLVRKELKECWAIHMRRNHHTAGIGLRPVARIVGIADVELPPDKALAAVAADEV